MRDDIGPHPGHGPSTLLTPACGPAGWIARGNRSTPNARRSLNTLASNLCRGGDRLVVTMAGPFSQSRRTEQGLTP
jgi:hypothetical protein